MAATEPSTSQEQRAPESETREQPQRKRRDPQPAPAARPQRPGQGNGRGRRPREEEQPDAVVRVDLEKHPPRRDWTPRPPSPAEMERIATENHLIKMGTVQPLGSYLHELWDRRHFVLTLSWSRFSATNSNDRLGMLWHVLRPLLQAAVYSLIFGLLLSRSRGKPPHYVEFVTTGVFVFHFLSGSLTSGAKAITGDLGLVRTLRFPRAALPLSRTLVELYGFLPSLAVLVIILVGLGERPHMHWLLLPVAVALTGLFGLGLAMFAARITSMVRDFVQLLPFMLRITFYLSGVIVNIETLGGLAHHDLLRRILVYEPFHIYINLVRQCLLSRGEGVAAFSLTEWVWGAVWALSFSVAGFLFFRSGEETYGR